MQSAFEHYRETAALHAIQPYTCESYARNPRGVSVSVSALRERCGQVQIALTLSLLLALLSLLLNAAETS